MTWLSSAFQSVTNWDQMLGPELATDTMTYQSQMITSLIRLLTCILCVITHIDINSSLQEPMRQEQRTDKDKMHSLNKLNVFNSLSNKDNFFWSYASYLPYPNNITFRICYIRIKDISFLTEDFLLCSFVIIFSSAFQAEYNMIPTRNYSMSGYWMLYYSALPLRSAPHSHDSDSYLLLL